MQHFTHHGLVKPNTTPPRQAMDPTVGSGNTAAPVAVVPLPSPAHPPTPPSTSVVALSNGPNSSSNHLGPPTCSTRSSLPLLLPRPPPPPDRQGQQQPATTIRLRLTPSPMVVDDGSGGGGDGHDATSGSKKRRAPSPALRPLQEQHQQQSQLPQQPSPIKKLKLKRPSPTLVFPSSAAPQYSVTAAAAVDATQPPLIRLLRSHTTLFHGTILPWLDPWGAPASTALPTAAPDPDPDPAGRSLLRLSLTCKALGPLYTRLRRLRLHGARRFRRWVSHAEANAFPRLKGLAVVGDGVVPGAGEELMARDLRRSGGGGGGGKGAVLKKGEWGRSGSAGGGSSSTMAAWVRAYPCVYVTCVVNIMYVCDTGTLHLPPTDRSARPSPHTYTHTRVCARRRRSAPSCRNR